MFNKGPEPFLAFTTLLLQQSNCLNINMVTNKSKDLRVGQDQVRVCERRNVNFVVLLTRWDLVLPLAKYAATARGKTIPHGQKFLTFEPALQQWLFPIVFKNGVRNSHLGTGTEILACKRG